MPDTLADATVGADLVVLEGMGRSIITNYNTLFRYTCCCCFAGVGMCSSGYVQFILHMTPSCLQESLLDSSQGMVSVDQLHVW